MSGTTTIDAIGRGRPYRLGADPLSDSVNFSVYSEDCDRIELLLFDAVDDPRPACWRRVTGLLAGVGQMEAQVLKVGMIGEVTCIATPWQIIPVVVTEVRHVIASGQVRPPGTLVDVQRLAKPGTITAIMEPLYAGQIDDLPQGGSCIANVYTNSHEALQDPEIGALRRFGLHAIDTVGLVHAMILRIQALLLPIQTLVLGGH